MADFLLEIGTEEIPAGYLHVAALNLANNLAVAVHSMRLAAGENKLGDNPCYLYSPRRIVVFMTGLADRQPDITEEVLGPPANKAFDADGKPTKAALGFARSHGVSPEDLVIKETRRGKCCAATVTNKGKTAGEVLAEILPGIIAGMSFPKSMWWGINSPDGGKLRFARPIRRIAALLDGDTVNFSIGSLESDNKTIGHFFTNRSEIEISSADKDSYCRLLEEHDVIVDHGERKKMLDDKIDGLRREALLSNPGNRLDSIADIVEYPNILEGRFDDRFLKLPPEVVEEILVVHQKYFPVRKDKVLQSRFLAVFDRPDGADVDTIRRNCERVVGARLEDGAFFLEQDRKVSFRDRAAELERQVFHEKLGDYRQKTERLVELSAFIAGELDLSEDDAKKASKAAGYCKADLVTTMVTEFPGLQGVVGRIYALEDGIEAGVAKAIEEHYQTCPGSLPGKVLSLADAFDNIVGYFSVGEEPTSTGDPHGLRRQVLGAAQCILALGGDKGVEKRLLFSSAIHKAAELHGLKETEYRAGDIHKFIFDRLYNYFVFERKYLPIITRAAMASGYDDVYGLVQRLDALLELSEDSEWEGLVELVERTYKIGRDVDLGGTVQEELLEEDQEKEVWRILGEVRPRIESLFSGGHYTEGSRLYAESLAGPVHKFFDDVFVNVENEDVKLNRMLLMRNVFELYAENMADLSIIASG